MLLQHFKKDDKSRRNELEKMYYIWKQETRHVTSSKLKQ